MDSHFPAFQLCTAREGKCTEAPINPCAVTPLDPIPFLLYQCFSSNVISMPWVCTSSPNLSTWIIAVCATSPSRALSSAHALWAMPLCGKLILS